MVIIECIEMVKKFFMDVMGQQCRVLTVMKEEDKWKALCEVLVDPGYTTRRGFGDIVEIYEIYLNDDQEVIGYQLTDTKARLEIDD